MACKQRHVFLFGVVALVVAAVLVGVVWSNMEHHEEEDNQQKVKQLNN